MIPIIVIYQVAAIAASEATQSAAKWAQEHPGEPMPVQQIEPAKPDRWGEFLFLSYIVVYGLAFAALPTLFLYCVIKFAFAAHGMKFP